MSCNYGSLTDLAPEPGFYLDFGGFELMTTTYRQTEMEKRNSSVRKVGVLFCFQLFM